MLTSEAKDLHRWAKEIMARGSLSFSLATHFFGRDTRASVRLLYTWCRYCDDQIDRAPTREAQIASLERLEFYTKTIYAEFGQEVLPREFQAMAMIVKRYAIPEHYPRDLLRGMRADVEGKEYTTFAELEDYAYCVAGTVGLMMSHIMGVSSPRAYRHAVDLGIALQLTNIARDLNEDFALGRVYLPSDWLQEVGVVRRSFASEAIARERGLLIRRLVRLADRYYFSGFNGLQYLPWKASLAVRVAALVYRKIGVEVARDPDRAWGTRTVVSRLDKFSLVFVGLWGAFLDMFRRLWRPPGRFTIHELEKPL